MAVLQGRDSAGSQPRQCRQIGFRNRYSHGASLYINNYFYYLNLATPAGPEPVFFISAGIQTAVTGTYAQQVGPVLRVIRGVRHAVGMRLTKSMPNLNARH